MAASTEVHRTYDAWCSDAPCDPAAVVTTLGAQAPSLRLAAGPQPWTADRSSGTVFVSVPSRSDAEPGTASPSGGEWSAIILQVRGRSGRSYCALSIAESPVASDVGVHYGTTTSGPATCTTASTMDGFPTP